MTKLLGSTMRSVLLTTLLFTLAPLVVVSTGGCAALVPVLSKVVAAVTEAGQILDMIDASVRSWFARKPDPELEKDYARAMGAARLALSAALKTTTGVERLSQEDVDAAFADFRQAYGDVVALLTAAGVAKPAGTEAFVMASADGEALTLPTPMALSLRVDE